MSTETEAKVRAALESLLREIREKRTTGEASLHFPVYEGGPRQPIKTTLVIVSK